MPISDDIEEFWKVVRPLRIPTLAVSSATVAEPQAELTPVAASPRISHHIHQISMSRVTKRTLALSIATRVIQDPHSVSEYVRFRVTAKDLMPLPREALIRLAVNLGLRLNELTLTEEELPEMDTRWLS